LRLEERPADLSRLTDTLSADIWPFEYRSICEFELSAHRYRSIFNFKYRYRFQKSEIDRSL